MDSINKTLASSQHEQTMNTRLLQIIGSKQAIWVPPSTSLRIAFVNMSSAKVGALVISEQMAKPVGIITTSDLVDRVILPELPLSTPIGEVMSKNPLTLPAEATAYDAALLMAEHGIRHVIVVDNKDKLLGIVSERDLFSLQSIGLSHLRRAIDRAYDRAAIFRCAEDVRKMALTMQQQGIGADQLTQFISLLNDALTRRIIRINLLDQEIANIPWCWLAFGSEGRDEQTFSTDQDNGIIFLPADNQEASSYRSNFLEFAKAINDDLDSCGFPLCKGEIMASNPRWCLSLLEWKKQFSSWINEPHPDALLNSSIFFDFRAIYGDLSLANNLREHLLNSCKNSSAFLRAMATTALDVSPPLNWLGNLKTNLETNRPGTIDLKKYGTRLIIDVARILALANAVAATNTHERLKAISEKKSNSEIVTAQRIFSLLQTLRVQHQCQQISHGEEPDNLLLVKALNPLDRRMLNSGMSEIKNLQLLLRTEFQVSA